MRGLIVLLLFFCLSQISFARFAPTNDLKIYSDSKSANMDEIEFNQIVDKLEEIYAPVVANRGANLKIIRKWEDPTVNAFAVPNGNDWEVHLFGGLARHDKMTKDGFMMVVCHELGHHLGGAPKYTSWRGTEWASCEGQSDYFAGKCAKLFMDWTQQQEQEQGQNLVAEIKCKEVYENSELVNKCTRIATAGEALGKTLASMGGRLPPSLNTPETSTVYRTNTTGYPSVQCRVDTYFAGALCNVDPTSESDEIDAKIGYCDDGSGIRPACWYVSKEDINDDNDYDWPWDWDNWPFIAR